MVVTACNYCGKEFVDKANRRMRPRKYCSVPCYRLSRRHRVDKTCPQCGKVFIVIFGRRNQMFCSRECLNASKKTTKTCPICGEEFVVLTSIAHRYNVCSIQCRTATTKYIECKRCGKIFRAEKGLNRHYCSEICRRPPVIIACRNCGKKFRRCPSEKTRQFCSFSCYRSFKGETLLEKRLRESLEKVGISFVQEFQVGRYSIDFALKQARVALEVDGEYWHDPVKDRRRDHFLKRHGWYVIRFKEREVLNISDLNGLIIARLEELPRSELARIFPSKIIV